MRKKIIIGNWKMNKNSKDVKEFFNYFNNNNVTNKKITFGIAASFCDIPFVEMYRPNDEFIISAQDISFNESGAFTGEVSPYMLKDLSVSHVIVGHSERRKYHNETNEIVNKKAKNALLNNITPIICVGENIDDFNNNLSKEIIKNQVINSTKDLDFKKIIIAYEPLWAIGTGKNASIEYAQDMCKFIREITSNDITIQYGGSVNLDSVTNYLNQPDIDGALIGAASLDPKNFLSILKKCEKIKE